MKVKMGKNKMSSTKDSKNASTNNQSQQIKKGNRTIKNNVSKTKTSKGSDPDESKKIHYVLNPKKIKEKMLEVKETERRAKEKSYQTQKRKRNSAYLRTTSKGQPALNARMKVLYGQIQKSFATEK